MSGSASILAVTGGSVIDPHIGPLEGAAVFIEDGRFAAVETDAKKIKARLKSISDENIFDATGKLVTPGLVDLINNQAGTVQ